MPAQVIHHPRFQRALPTLLAALEEHGDWQIARVQDTQEPQARRYWCGIHTDEGSHLHAHGPTPVAAAQALLDLVRG